MGFAENFSTDAEWLTYAKVLGLNNKEEFLNK